MIKQFAGLVGIIVAIAFTWFWVSDTKDHEKISTVQVKVPQLTTFQLAGEKAFNSNCAVCHGVNAAGQQGKGPPLIHKIYEPSHHSDMSFVLAAKQGVRQHHWSFGNMPPIAGVSDQDIQSVISYVRAVQRENGIN